MIKIYPAFIVAIFAFMACSLNAQVCGDRYQADVFTNVDVTTVQFGANVTDNGTPQDLFMDIYQPAGDTATNRPVVLFTFGGSFTGGARTSGELVYMATELAKKGYVCASIDYRVTSSVFNLINEENMVKVVFGAVQDGKAAIRFFRQDAETDNNYNIDPEQIFIGGTSAGGILAINLAYVTDLSLLPNNWQTWASEIGGLEGASGNPGYCSYPTGVFGFAGAVGDTSYISETDVPFYGSHATGDQTVLYGFGPPLNGLAPVDLYGSGLIDQRMTNLGVYTHLDTYSGGDHPPLAGSNAVMEATKDSLAMFLFNILDCNPQNRKNANQRDCSDFNPPIGIWEANADAHLSVYPNPTSGAINFNAENIEFVGGFVLNTIGEKVYECTTSDISNKSINLKHLNAGLYILQLHSHQGTVSNTFVIE